MKHALPAILITICSLVFAQQDEPKPSNRDFDRAQQVETMEGDLLSAVDLYARAAKNESLDEVVRTKARYRMGLIYRKLGRDHDAKIVLTKASTGKGKAAKQAQEVLAGKEPQDEEDWSVQGRIHRSIEKIRGGDTRREGEKELTLIGEPAIKYLVEAIKKDKSDFSFVSRGVGVLVTIGGEKVAKWLQEVANDKDVYYRRAVIRSINDIRKQNETRRNLSSTLLTTPLRQFLADSDGQTTRWAISILASLSTQLTEIEYRNLLMHPDVSVKDYFLTRAGGMGIRSLALGDNKIVERLAGPMRSCFDAGPIEVQRGIVRLLTYIHSYNATAARLYLDLLVSARGPIAQDKAWSTLRDGTKMRQERMSAAETLALAKKAPDGFFDDYATSDGQQAYEQYPRQQAFHGTVDELMHSWKSKEIPEMIELLRMKVVGNSHSLATKIVRSATIEEIPIVLANLDAFAWPSDAFNLVYKGEPDPSYLAPMKDWLDKYLSKERTDKSLQLAPVSAVIPAIAHLKTPEAIEYLAGIARKSPGLYRQVVKSFVQYNMPRELVIDHLVKMLRYDGKSNFADVGRFDCFIAVYETGRKDAIENLVRAARAGMLERSYYHHPNTNKSIKIDSRFRTSDRGEDLIRPLHPTKYSGEDQARIFGEILRIGNKKYLEDFGYALKYSNYQRDAGKKLSKEIYDLATELVFEVEGETQQRVFEFIQREPACTAKHNSQFIIRALRELPQMMRASSLYFVHGPIASELADELRGIMKGDNTQLVQGAIRVVAKHGAAGFADEMKKLLEHQNSAVRSSAMTTLVQFKKEAAIEDILKLANDPSSVVRKSLCAVLVEIPNKDVIPFLVEALRDPSNEVRKTAESSLKRVQYYLEQKSNWDRYLSGSGMDEPSAVAALLKQAKAGNEKSVRILAIESLGTMAAKETLPILIQFTTEKDPDIVKAAQKSIAKINK